MKTRIRNVAVTLLGWIVLVAATGTPEAALEVHDAWARASVPGQTASGAFMELKSPVALELTAVRTPVAALAEVHEMVQNGDRMSMHAVGKLTLPAGTTIELKPNGLHVMLFDLKQPLVAGEHFPLTLELSDAKGRRSEKTLDVVVRPLGGTAP
jgi:copper(I)-binding protein